MSRGGARQSRVEEEGEKEEEEEEGKEEGGGGKERKREALENMKSGERRKGKGT